MSPCRSTPPVSESSSESLAYFLAIAATGAGASIVIAIVGDCMVLFKGSSISTRLMTFGEDFRHKPGKRVHKRDKAEILKG